MIIDLILDRKGFEEDGYTDYYNAYRFYDYCRGEAEIWEDFQKIPLAMDYGDNEDVQRELCNYIISGNYNPEICDYIKSVNWI